LGPTLERAVQGRAGKLDLVKVDTDANPGLAERYGIRGIPAVKAFRDGDVVAEFVGAQPAEAVERFLDGIVPSEADALAAEADEQSLRRALELEPGHAEAATALARLLLERWDARGALELLESVSNDPIAEGLAARAQLALSGAAERDAELAAALDALNRGEAEFGLERLAALVEQADEETRELVRRAMVGVFTELGSHHPLSTTYRRRLAATLY
jgi:putative thioredoxin